MLCGILITKMEFQIISWDSRDTEREDATISHVITMYGRTAQGKSVVASCVYNPSFYIEVPDSQTKSQSLISLNWQNSKWSFNQFNPIATQFVWRERFVGFSNNRQSKFLKLTFSSKASWKSAFWRCKRDPKFKNKIYEANIDPVLRFIHECDIESTGWITIENKDYYEKDFKETFSDIEIFIKHPSAIQRIDIHSISPVVLCSFDIEVHSEDGSFPDPLSSSNYCPIIQIACTYERYGDEKPFLKELFTLNTCDVIEDVHIHECKSENELIKKWVKGIQIHNPDILIGYNIWKFDLHYIMQRAAVLNLTSFINLNRERGEPSVTYDAKFSSSAYGDNEYKMVTSTGRIQLDLLELYKREHKLIKYSLNFVAEHFLKDKKLDMPIKELFARFKTGSSQDMYEIGKYCVKDTELPLRLMRTLNDVPNLMEMAKATYVPMNFLLERGQQIKVFSQITKQTRLENMLVITPCDSANKESFIGATVLNAEKDAYMDEVVTGLDFASLYPTIMRAHNLCYSTIVQNEKYAHIDGTEYEDFEWTSDDKTFKYRFAQTKQGILPKILENLAKNRKQAKKDMANATSASLKSVYNGKQLAFKVSMNSIYGFCAAYMLPCQPISATVTTIGRNMITHTKTLVETWYPGSRVIYGDTDSVMVIFDTTTDNKLKESFELGQEAAKRISATFKFPIELEFEKCYYPYLLFSKKRYAGLMYTNPEKPDYIDAKGIQLVRRDNPDFVKNVCKTVLHMIMYERKVFEAMEYAQECGQQLLDGKIPVQDLILSKSLRKDYACCKKAKDEADEKRNHHIFTNHRCAISHVNVARKIGERNPGSQPKSGDRVPYVFMDTKIKKQLQWEKAEDPTYVIENNLKLDTLYYLEHSLISPLASLFELFTDNPKNEIFGEIISKHLRKETGQKQLCDFWETTNGNGSPQPPTALKKKSTNPKQHVTTTTQKTLSFFI